MNRAQLENEAMNRLSSYEGDGLGYEGEDNYVGVEDDSVDFCGTGARSFISEADRTVPFQFKVVNTFATTKKIVLNPGYLNTTTEINDATGESVDGILADGAFLTDTGVSVTATAGRSKHKITPWLRFLKTNPHRVRQIIIESNTDLAFNETMVIQTVSPYRTMPNKYLLLTDYVKPDQYNNKKAYIDLDDVQIDDQTLIFLNIGGTNIVATTGVSLNFTFKMGAMKNPALELDKKAKRALKNVDKMVARGSAMMAQPHFRRR